MDEDTICKIMKKYFESKGMKPIRSKGAGPDFLMDGKAIEVKGSRVRNDFHRMIRQLADYAKKFTMVELALPFDGLNLKQAEQLGKLFFMIENAKGFWFKLYVVVDNPSKKNSFFVKEYKAPHLVQSDMSFEIPYPKPTVSTLDVSFEKLILL